MQPSKTRNKRTTLIVIRALETSRASSRASPLVAEHGSRHGRRASTHGRGALALRPAAPDWGAEAALLLEVAPPLHRDLAAVEFAVLVMPAFVGACDCPCRLSSVTPTEVVKVPERVGWEDEVPDWQGEEVDQHPCDVYQSVGGDDDEDTGETEHEDQEDEGNGRYWRVCESRFESDGDCESLLVLIL
jgi:hypothetical protein